MPIDYSKFKKKDELESTTENKITPNQPTKSSGIDYSKFVKVGETAKPTTTTNGFDYNKWYTGVSGETPKTPPTKPRIDYSKFVKKSDVDKVDTTSSDWYTGMSGKVLEAPKKKVDETKLKYEPRKKEIEEEIRSITNTPKFLGVRALPLGVLNLSDEEKEKVRQLQFEYTEMDRLEQAGKMGFGEGYLPVNIEKARKKEAQRIGAEDVYKGEELQQQSGYKTGRLIGTGAQFLTAYMAGGGAVETGAKNLAKQIAPKIPYGAIGSNSAMNVIRTGLSTALTSGFGVELAKDIVLGTPLNIQEAREQGLKDEDFANYMKEQFLIDAAMNSTIIVGGKIFKGIKNTVLNKQQSEAAFELIESELRNKHGLTGEALEQTMTKIRKQVIDAGNVVSEAARSSNLEETLGKISASENVEYGLESYLKRIKDYTPENIEFKPGAIDLPSFTSDKMAVRIGGEVFNLSQQTDTTFKLINKAGVKIELPKEVVNTFGEFVKDIPVNKGLAKTRTQIDSLELQNNVLENVFKKVTNQIDKTGSVNLSKETYENLFNQVSDSLNSSLNQTRIQVGKYKQQFKTQAINELKDTLGKVEEMLPEYRDAIKEITDNLDVKKLTSKKRLRLESLKNYINNAADELDYYQVPKNLIDELDRLEKIAIKDLDYTQVDNVVRVVKHIEHLENTKKTLLSNVKDKTIKQAVDGTLKFDIDKPKVEKLTPVQNVLENISRSGALNLDRITRMIGKWDANNPLHGIYKQIEEGYSTKMKLHVKEATELNEGLLKSLDLEAVGKQVNPEQLSSDSVRQMYEELTVMEKVELYLNTKSAYNYKNLVDENGGIYYKDFVDKINLTRKDVDLIIDSLTDSQKSYGDMLFDFNNKVSKGRLNQTSVLVDGYEIATIPNYHSVLPKSGSFKIGQGVGKRTIEGASILQERTGKVTTVRLIGADEHFKAYNEAVANYYGLAAPLRDFKAVLNNESVQKSLRKRFGDNIINTLDKKVTALEGGIFMESDPVTGAMRKTIRNVQTAILGLNPKVVLNQLASIPTAMAEVDAKYFFGEIGNIETMKKYSPELWDRFRGFVTRESAEAMERGSEWATVLIRKSDQKAIQTIWGAVEREIKATTDLSVAKNADEFYNAVARRVEEVVHRTQPNYNELFTSGIGSTKNLGVRLATMFTTQRNQNYQILYEGIAEAIANGNTDKAVRSIASVAFASLTIAGINKGASAYRGYESDIPSNFANSFISNMYGAGYISNAFIEGFKVDNIMESSLNDVYYAISKLTSETSKGEGIKDLTLALSKLQGIPLENVEKTIKNGLRFFRPELYYEYEKFFDEPTRREMYDNFEEAIKAGDIDFINNVMKDMVDDGVEYSNLKNSMSNRGINEFVYSRYKDQLQQED